MVLTQRRLGYLRVGTLSLLGADPNITELRSPLVAPGEEVRVASALRRSLAGHGGWDWIRWSCVDRPLHEALVHDAPVSPRGPIKDYILDLAPTWEALRGRLKRNVRESLRHCYNSLKRDGVTFEFEVASAPDAVRRASRSFSPCTPCARS